MNAIKDSIKSGRTVVGTTVTPNVDVSILADAGYDFLLFDTQHSAWEIKQLQPSIQTMRGKQAAPLVRVAANQAYQICFALDAGARGIVVPMVNTSAEAEAAVRACRYFPLGNRSNAGVRGEWGEFKNYRDYLDTVNNVQFTTEEQNDNAGNATNVWVANPNPSFGQPLATFPQDGSRNLQCSARFTF